MIYAIHAKGTSFYKFGHTAEANTRDRLRSLQTGSPFELEIVAIGKGGRDEEQRIHASLKAVDCHHMREWFNDCQAVQDAILWIQGRKKALPAPPPLKHGRKRLERVLEYVHTIDIERHKPKIKARKTKGQPAEGLTTRTGAREEAENPLVAELMRTWIACQDAVSHKCLETLKNQWAVSSCSSVIR